MTWKSIDGYEGLYEVSDTGLVRSLWFGKKRILSPGNAGKGYLFVGLYKDGICRKLLVHRLVANAFIPNPLNLETVNHKDEDKTNNNVSNLEWMSQADNLVYSCPQLAKRKVQMFDKKTGELLAAFPSTYDAEHRTGIAQSSICGCCRGQRKSVGGYVWKYA